MDEVYLETMKRHKPVSLFLSYAREDEEMRCKLEQHLNCLNHQQPISIWHDGKIDPSTNWAMAIDEHLETASLILLLISVDFLHSEHCKIEMERALELHEAGSVRVIPIILRHVYWDDCPFRMLQVLPKDGRPITQWKDQDEAYVDVTRGIRKAIKELPSSGGKPPRLSRPFLKFSKITSIITLILVLVFVPSSLQGKPQPALRGKTLSDLFPTLCNSNFQSVHIGRSNIDKLPTSKSPDGRNLIGLSEGANIFDPYRSNKQDKLQATRDTIYNPQLIESSLKKAIKDDPTDAEAQIYLENQQVLASAHPYITLVVGVNFNSPGTSGVDYNGTSRGTLQGAFTAQKECNDNNRQDPGKTLVVLMIANISGKNLEDRAKSATFVADQIVDQAGKDPTIIGILGWLFSADSLDVNHELIQKGSDLPMVSPGSASNELTVQANFFRVCLENSEQASAAVRFMKIKQKKRIATLYDQDTSYGNDLEERFVDAASMLKANIVASEPYTEGDLKTLQHALNNVLTHNPDAIFFSGYEDDLFKLLDSSPSTSFANILIVGAAALASTNDYTSLPQSPNKIYFPADANPNEWAGTGQTPPFFQEYQDNFQTTLASKTGLPSIDADVMLSYDGLLTILHASQQVLSQKNTINASDLENSLKGIKGTNAIQGVTGRIAFDSSDGNRDSSKMIFVEHIEGTDLKVDYQQGCLRVTDVRCQV